MRKILLNKNKGKKNVNNENIIPVDFNRDYNHFQDEKMVDTLDTLKLYNDEKDSSTKHRFIFTISPLCTNVLFNPLTEIIYKEGSDECDVLKDTSGFEKLSMPIGKSTPTRIDAIRNTEYSNEIHNLNYHCGIDIFNNHLLRKKEDVSVQKIVSPSDDSKDKFNTIEDYKRNYDGFMIEEYGINNKYVYDSDIKFNSRLYNYDTIYSFVDAYKTNIKRNNGWMGFYNPSTIRIPVRDEITSNKAYYVNKCINNVEPCQFIDMAPERDLFYFTPKKNPYRHRLEYNWDYCLTYPAESVNEVVLNDGTNINLKNGLPILYIKEYESDNNIPLLLLCTPINHNLNVNDIVEITYKPKTSETEVSVRCNIVSVGYLSKPENDNRFFSIRKNDFDIDNSNVVLNDISGVTFSKVQNGYKCNYYFRKFHQFNNGLKNTINRLAFANNIYGDEISQLVFTDDLNVSGYRDNLNRPLTEVYLTIIKTNKGNKKWYIDGCYNDSDIEYSHVFGEVTSGIDIPYIKVDSSASYKNNNLNLPIVRQQHNIDKYEKQTASKIESDIKIINNTGETFFGDLVEFSPSSFSEVVIEEIKHRFNTMQRELNGGNTDIDYNKIHYDEIDNIDPSSGFSITSMTFGTGKTLNPEGYIYKPHHRVKIGEFSSIVKQKSNLKIYVENNMTVDSEKKTTTFISNEYADVYSNDKIIIFKTGMTTPSFYNVIYCISKDNKYEIKVEGEINNNEINDIHKNGDDMLFIFKYDNQTPEYAHIMYDKTGISVWRDYIKPSNYSYTSDLYSTPFTNDAFYHHTNILFPVQRQDAYKEYNIRQDNIFDIAPTPKEDVLTDNYIEKLNELCF